MNRRHASIYPHPSLSGTTSPSTLGTLSGATVASARRIRIAWLLPCLLLALAAACADGAPDGTPPSETVRVDGIELQAEVETSGFLRVKIISTVVATNVSDETVEFGYGYCSIWARAHRQPDRTGAPLWDQAEQPRTCPDALLIAILLPDSSVVTADTTEAWLLPRPYFWAVSFDVEEPVDRVVELRG